MFFVYCITVFFQRTLTASTVSRFILQIAYKCIIALNGIHVHIFEYHVRSLAVGCLLFVPSKQRCKYGYNLLTVHTITENCVRPACIYIRTHLI